MGFMPYLLIDYMDLSRLENNDYLHGDITSLIIKAYYNVYNKLGFGFLEKVYENAMVIELGKFGLRCEKIKANYCIL